MRTSLVTAPLEGVPDFAKGDDANRLRRGPRCARPICGNKTVLTSHVLIPCKGFTAGKSRLAPLLSDVERAQLCRRMLEATIDVAARVFSRNRIWVLTADRDAAALARLNGVKSLHDEAGNLNGALEKARTSLREQAPAPEEIASLVVLPTDLPLATEGSIRKFVAIDADVAVTSDLARRGTNLLRLRGRSMWDFPFSFGEGSLNAHRHSAENLAYSFSISHDARLAFDLDEPCDFVNLKSTSDRHSRAAS